MQKKRSTPRRNLFTVNRHGHAPLIFAIESVAVIALALVVLELAFFLQTTFVSPKINLFGSVLPAAIISLTNADRFTVGAPTLVRDSELSRAAQMKADDMATRGYFSHVSPDGKSPWYWIDKIGYPYSYAGENLAIDFTDSADVETAWMNSPAHHANIVKPQYSRIGIGVAEGMYQGKNTTFVVELFATPPVASEMARSVSQEATSSNVTATSATTSVLSAQIEPAQNPPSAPLKNDSVLSGDLATLISSPNRVSIGLLLVLLISILTLLVAAFLHKLSWRHFEVILGGVVLCALIIILLFYHAAILDNVTLPLDGQSASVVSAISLY